MGYILHILIYFTIFAIAGMSLNLIVGYTGLFSITHASFYGIGAYATALLMTKLGTGFFASVAAGMLITSLVCILIGVVMSKFNDDYYSIVSLGFNMILFAIALNWDELTGGSEGIFGVPRPAVFGHVLRTNEQFLILSSICFIIAFLICRFIVGTSFGRVLKTIREDEKTIEVFGYHTTVYKLVIFLIGSMMASVAGSLYASYIGFINTNVASVNESIFLFVVIIIGGLANLYGSMAGALFVIAFPEALRFLGLPTTVAAQIQQLLYGISLTLLMLFRPQGIIGEYKL